MHRLLVGKSGSAFRSARKLEKTVDLWQTPAALGSLIRCSSTKRSRSRSSRHTARSSSRDRDRHENHNNGNTPFRHGDRGLNGSYTNGRRRGNIGPPKLVYYVTSDPPSPPPFDPKTLGIQWTKPSIPVGQHPSVKHFLIEGEIRHFPRGSNEAPADKASASAPFGSLKYASQSTVEKNYKNLVSEEESLQSPKSSVVGQEDQGRSTVGAQSGKPALASLDSQEQVCLDSSRRKKLISAGSKTKWWDAFK
jgi:hypothetical protein